MKILLIHSFYKMKYPSGENNAVNELKKSLDSQLDVSTFFYQTPSKETFFRKCIYAVNVLLGVGKSPRKMIGKKRPDIIHVHNLFPNISRKWMRNYKGSSVLTLHNFRSFCANGLFLRNGTTCTLCFDKNPKYSLMYKCYRGSIFATLPWYLSQLRDRNDAQYLRRFTAIIYLNKYMKEYLEILNLGNKFQKFIPNPINVQQTNLHKNTRSFFLYVGTLSDEKGITELCNNWKIDYPNLFVIGDGPSRNKLPIKSNIQYLGYQNRSQVLDFISKAKALIIPSLCLENLPTVYIEAMSQGTPVLVNAKCSVSSLVFEEKTGEIFSNFSNIYHHLVELENNWSIFNQNASKAYETIYSDDVVRSQLISLYKDLYVER